MKKQKLLFIEKVPNYPCHGHQIYLNDINDNADLHRSKQISTNFDKEIYRIKKKFLTADYPQKFVTSVIRNFENDKIENVEYIIPPGLFDIAKPVIIIEVSFCTKNEVSSKQFMRKFHNFKRAAFDLRIK